jgi:hypothetical protein
VDMELLPAGGHTVSSAWAIVGRIVIPEERPQTVTRFCGSPSREDAVLAKIPSASAVLISPSTACVSVERIDRMKHCARKCLLDRAR